MKIDPNPEKLEEAARRLLAIHENMGPGHATVDFSEMRIDSVGTCGTVACHAGWLVVALAGATTLSEVKSHHGDFYTDGEVMMDEWLGWSTNGGHFPLWAEAHPELWGNDHGRLMYADMGSIAFGHKAGDVTLETIAARYKDVAKRIRGSENES